MKHNQLPAPSNCYCGLKCGETYPLSCTVSSIVLRPRPIPMPTDICQTLQRGKGDLWTAYGMSKHRVSKHRVDLLFCNDLARMNDTPQPNQIRKVRGCWESISWMQVSHLTTGPFLTAKTTRAPGLLEKMLLSRFLENPPSIGNIITIVIILISFWDWSLFECQV